MSEGTKPPQSRPDSTTATQYKPGQTGNPGGRTRMDPTVKAMLLAATPKAVKTLVDALDAERALVVGSGEDARIQLVPDYDLRVKAAGAVLDRVYGKPTQVVTGEDGSPVVVAVDLAAMLERLAK